MKLLAGPCVIEERDTLMRIAEGLAPLAHDKRIDFYFKASFDKANRTSLESYRGPGMEKGLAMLEEVKRTFGYKIITDFHTPDQAAPVAEVADIIQIPAFLARQTDMVVAAARTKAIVNIKKGQFMAPNDMQYGVVKALKTRGIDATGYDAALQNDIWITERGATFGYGNLVVDMRSFPIMRAFAPVIFDATHAVQMPSAAAGKTGGDRTMVPYLAKAAAAVGVDGFFFETHIDPSCALSDGPNMLPIEALLALVPKLFAIAEASN
ncbi:MAG: 2-dehydro-3-deoxyphosphooctonate aldolase [Sulfuricurvum sp. PC08-66]|nr:MAG: 2-dehydro-3-deoxyphosphooctonate aldolase [Sulfuricurvum sp. PC08-66]